MHTSRISIIATAIDRGRRERIERRRGRLLASSLVALLIGLGLPPAASAEANRIDFDGSLPGSAPAGFSIAQTGGGEPAKWVVEADPINPANRVLVQRSADPTSGRFPLIVYDAASARDVAVNVRFKPIAGKVDRAAGIVWRYRDRDNYYLVRANALEGNVVLYKVEGGKRSDLKPVDAGLFAYGKKVPVPSDAWSALRVEAKGNRFAVALDGKHLFDVEDETFAAPGKVGLWTKADSVTAFDDLTIEPLDGTRP